jgi:hypothetical protein
LSITKDPIFKSVIFAIALMSAALFSQSVFAAKGGKPEPLPQPSHVVWVDAKGVMLGDAQTYVDSGGTTVFFEANENLYRAVVTDGRFYGVLYYDLPGCAGNAYTDEPYIRGGAENMKAVRDYMFYVADGDLPRTVTIASRWTERDAEGYRCRDTNGALNLYPVVPFFDANIYAKPYQLKLIPAN